MTDYDNDEARNVDEVEDRIIALENTSFIRQREDGIGTSTPTRRTTTHGSTRNKLDGNS